MRPQVHVREVEPAEERLIRRVLALDEILGRGGELVVAGLHALPCERTRVLDGLLTDAAPARLLGRVILVRRVAVQDAARTELRPKFREVFGARVVRILRVFFRIEVVEIPKELVEPVGGRQVLVAVAEMVLAELAGRIADGS